MGAVHARADPVELTGRVELGEQGPVQSLEDSGPLPAVQASPAGLPGSEPQLQRQELPGNVLVQDVQDALQTQPIIIGLGPGDRVGQGGSSGQQSLCALTQPCVVIRFRHPVSWAHREATGVRRVCQAFAAYRQNSLITGAGRGPIAAT